MKPLVNYCRWNRAKLRLRSRDEQFLKGQLVFRGNEGDEIVENFTYELAPRRLTLEKETGERILTLDEMGVVTNEIDRRGEG